MNIRQDRSVPHSKNSLAFLNKLECLSLAALTFAGLAIVRVELLTLTVNARLALLIPYSEHTLTS